VNINHDTVIIEGKFYRDNHNVFLAQLAAHGLQANRDYTWRYLPSGMQTCVNTESPILLQNSHTKITFTDAKWAVYFRLKWLI
jgi:hypothetical protein